MRVVYRQDFLLNFTGNYDKFCIIQKMQQPQIFVARRVQGDIWVMRDKPDGIKKIQISKT